MATNSEHILNWLQQIIVDEINSGSALGQWFDSESNDPFCARADVDAWVKDQIQNDPHYVEDPPSNWPNPGRNGEALWEYVKDCLEHAAEVDGGGWLTEEPEKTSRVGSKMGAPDALLEWLREHCLPPVCRTPTEMTYTVGMDRHQLEDGEMLVAVDGISLIFARRSQESEFIRVLIAREILRPIRNAQVRGDLRGAMGQALYALATARQDKTRSAEVPPTVTVLPGSARDAGKKPAHSH